MNQIIDLPCILDKCILFPVCKQKDRIFCNVLINYIDSMYTERYGKKENKQLSHEDFQDVWKLVNEIFPNLTLVDDENMTYVGAPK